MKEINISEISKYLQGKSFRDIKNLIIKIVHKSKDLITTEYMIKQLTEIEKERRSLGEKAVRIPEIKWDDVGGLAEAKEEII